MFQGIADQITEAQREILRQETLQNYYEMLEKFRKDQIREQKKTNTAFSKFSFPHLSSTDLDQIPGLKSLFYVVFENQDNEEDKKRRSFIQMYLLLKSFPESIRVFSDEMKRIKPEVKSKREIRSLRILVRNIKESTMDKYFYQEVSTLLHFVEKAGEVKARSSVLDMLLKLGEELQQRLYGAVKNLKQEENWGSWEMFFSRKIQYDKIQPGGIDRAFEVMPAAESLMSCFSILAEPFFSTRDILILNKIADGFVEGLIDDMMQDWLVESKTKKMLSRINQALGTINLMVRTLTAMKEQNKNEISLMEVERKKRIEKTEEYVKKKLSQKV